MREGAAALATVLLPPVTPLRLARLALMRLVPARELRVVLAPAFVLLARVLDKPVDMRLLDLLAALFLVVRVAIVTFFS
jgi:hypothetical protein